MLRNEGADLAAHEMIRRAQHEAEGMERLSAEYLTLATLAQAERWDALLARSGLTDAELQSFGPARRTARSWPHSARPKPVVSTSKPPSPDWWPGAPWPTPPTSRRCSTAGSTAGPRRPPAGAGSQAISSPG